MQTTKPRGGIAIDTPLIQPAWNVEGSFVAKCGAAQNALASVMHNRQSWTLIN
jgi:hypothetical protein